MDKICVYTCITGNYDYIKEIENKEKGIDYYCFTNNKNLISKTWNVIYIEDENLSNVLLARKIKTLGHPLINNNYDVLMWMDGSVVFNRNIKDFINKYLKASDKIVCFKHSSRDNIKDECYECVKMRKETKENVKKILKFYEKENYKYDNGLIESTVYIKRTKDDIVNETLKIWFDMINQYSKRDQLSFNYAISKTGLKVNWINKKVFNNEWFKCKSHNYEKDIKAYRVYFNNIDSCNYNIDNDIQGDFKKDINKYKIELVAPCDTKKMVVELSKVPFIEVSSIKINKKTPKNIYYFNAIKLNSKVLFYNENCAFETYDYIKKGTKIVIEIIMNVSDVNSLTKYFENYNILENQTISLDLKINELKSQRNNLEYELKKIVNSKSWKIIRKFDKIRLKRK